MLNVLPITLNNAVRGNECHSIGEFSQTVPGDPALGAPVIVRCRMQVKQIFYVWFVVLEDAVVNRGSDISI